MTFINYTQHDGYLTDPKQFIIHSGGKLDIIFYNIIIAVHDVTAYGNYTKFGISSLVLSHFCGSIYVHIILYLISFIWEKSYIDYRTSDSYFSDLDVTVFQYILSVFNYGNYAWIHEVS